MGIRDIEIFKLEYKLDQLEKMKQKYEDELDVLIKTNSKENIDKTRLLISGLELNINKRKVKLNILKQDDLLKDEEIALLNNSDSIEGKYSIYRLDDVQRLGYITYSQEDEEQIGSIGYSVTERFRGHQYAYKSLKLLTAYLKANGVDNVTIVTTNDNIPSIKTMERFRKDVESTDESRKSVKRYSYKL